MSLVEHGWQAAQMCSACRQRRQAAQAGSAGGQHRWAAHAGSAGVKHRRAGQSGTVVVHATRKAGSAGPGGRCRPAGNGGSTHPRCPAVSGETDDGHLSQIRQAGVRLPWLLAAPCLHSGCITCTFMIVPAGYPSVSARAQVPSHMCWRVSRPCCAASPGLAAWYLHCRWLL
jgi:hypothetical protein